MKNANKTRRAVRIRFFTVLIADTLITKLPRHNYFILPRLINAHGHLQTWAPAQNLALWTLGLGPSLHPVHPPHKPDFPSRGSPRCASHCATSLRSAFRWSVVRPQKRAGAGPRKDTARRKSFPGFASGLRRRGV